MFVNFVFSKTYLYEMNSMVICAKFVSSFCYRVGTFLITMRKYRSVVIKNTHTNKDLYQIGYTIFETYKK